MAAGTTIAAQSQGPIVRIGFNDPDVAKAIEMGFSRLLVERSIDVGLSWTEITVPSERPVLEAGVIDYVHIDRMGSASYKYRIRYVSEQNGVCVLSDPSDSIDGAGAMLLQILTVAQLKQRYLFGVSLTNDNGEPLPDEVYEHYILSGIAWLEHELDIKILPTTITREAHDYYRGDYAEFNIIQLDNYPVISVEEYLVEYPSGQTVVQFPLEWVRVDPDHGILRLVPTAGTLSAVLIGQGGGFLPAIYSGMSHLPDLFKISYTAGFAAGQVPRNILDLIGMFASLGPFNIFGDLIAGAGIASISVSMDGLSQSIGTTSSATNAGYGARVIQYLKQIQKQVPHLRQYYKGIRLTSA
jgi:hypothetical protein